MTHGGASVTGIEDLADSILLDIFKYLEHQDLCLGVRDTSKRWRQLSYDFSLWRDINFANRDLTDEEFMSVLNNCSHVVSMNVENCYELSNLSFVSLGRSCPDLEKLVIAGTMISDAALLFIAKMCPKIQELVMYNCRYLSPNSQSALLRLSSLRSVGISQNLNRIVDDECEEGQAALSCLEELTLQNTRYFDLSNDWMHLLVHRLKKLHKLSCCGFMILDDDTLVAFAENCPYLDTVILNLTLIGDETLKAIGTKCRHLRHLSISCCRYITDVGLCCVADNCHRLKYLDISGSQPDEDEHQTSSHMQGNATDVAVQHFASHCPQLTHLNVSSCPGVTDLGLVAIAEGCPQLQHLEMTNCIAVTDSTVRAVAQNCRRFCYLQASECVQLTSHSINRLVRLCPGLHNLQLETCPHIAQLNFDPEPQESISGTSTMQDASDHSVPEGRLEDNVIDPDISDYDEPAEQSQSHCISRDITTVSNFTSISFRALKHLNLSCCSKIANSDLRQIASHCPYLQFISLYGCHRINDKGLEYLVKACRYLQYLNIECLRTYRSKFTDLTLMDIAEHCQNLQCLNIRGGLQFSKEYIKTVVNACPKLKELRCTMEVKGDVYQYMFLPRQPYKSELEGQLTWSQKYHPRYGNPVKQCHLNFKFHPMTASGR